MQCKSNATTVSCSAVARKCCPNACGILAGLRLVPHFINTTTFATRDFCSRGGASDAHTLPGSVRSEQRRLGQKEPSPGGLRRFSVLPSCVEGASSQAGL